jgi:tetratricopeptide (TPR) repeat protein
MLNNLSDKINHLFDEDRYEEARTLLEKELAKSGNESDHWLLTRLSTTYYEQRKYKQALQLVEKAHQQAPHCPLVLWDYAGTLDALGHSQQAIEVYMSLIERGAEKVGRDECGEGLEWAIVLLTDCYYRISLCLQDLNRSKEAWQFFVMYAKLRFAGAESIYADEEKATLRHVYEMLKALPARERVRSPRTGLKKFSKEAVRLLHAA